MQKVDISQSRQREFEFKKQHLLSNVNQASHIQRFGSLVFDELLNRWGDIFKDIQGNINQAQVLRFFLSALGEADKKLEQSDINTCYHELEISVPNAIPPAVLLSNFRFINKHFNQIKKKLNPNAKRNKVAKRVDISQPDCVQIANGVYDSFWKHVMLEPISNDLQKTASLGRLNKKSLIQALTKVSRDQEGGVLQYTVEGVSEKTSIIMNPRDFWAVNEDIELSQTEILLYLDTLLKDINEELTERSEKIIEIEFISSTEIERRKVQDKTRERFKLLFSIEFDEALEKLHLPEDIEKTLVSISADIFTILEDSLPSDESFGSIFNSFRGVHYDENNGIILNFEGISKELQSEIHNLLGKKNIVAILNKKNGVNIQIDLLDPLEERELNVDLGEKQRMIKAKAGLMDIDGTFIQPYVYRRFREILMLNYFHTNKIDYTSGSIDFFFDVNGPLSLEEYVDQFFIINAAVLNQQNIELSTDIIAEWINTPENQKQSYLSTLELLEQEGTPIFTEHAPEFIQQCVEGEFPVLVVTNSQRSCIEALDEYLRGLLTQVSQGREWICNGDAPQRKPHGDPYITAMEKYNLEPNEVVVFEDSAEGLGAVQNAKIPRNKVVVMGDRKLSNKFNDFKIRPKTF